MRQTWQAPRTAPPQRCTYITGIVNLSDGIPHSWTIDRMSLHGDRGNVRALRWRARSQYAHAVARPNHALGTSRQVPLAHVFDRPWTTITRNESRQPSERMTEHALPSPPRIFGDDGVVAGRAALSTFLALPIFTRKRQRVYCFGGISSTESE